MPTCVFRKCKNYGAKLRKDKGVTYHTFPTGEFLRQKWVCAVRIERSERNWTPSKGSTICSAHFKDTDKYTTMKGYTRLERSAVPIVVSDDVPEADSYTNTNVNKNDVKSISDSPRKATPRKRVRKLDTDKKDLPKKKKLIKKEEKRLNRKKICVKNILKDLKKKNFVSKQKIAELQLKAEPRALFDRLLQTNNSNKKHRKKYPSVLRKFALTLHFHSSAAYNYVRQRSRELLPHPRVLPKWYQNTSFLPGFTKQAFDILKQNSILLGTRIPCGLIVGEIALRHQTQWTGKHTKALVDYGSGPSENKEMATHAFVFTVVCLNEAWKIPVAYFLIKELSSETRATMILDCLRRSHSAGVDIVCLTFDGSAANLTAAKMLGCKLDDPKKLKTRFKHPDTKGEVAVFLDPCHMMKLVRNTFEAKRIIFNKANKKIRWQLLVNLNKLQHNQSLNFANKLTKRYLNFRNEITKVKLATQVLSKSVAKALQLCNSTLKSSLFNDSGPTIEFIELFNDLFDIFSSRTRNSDGLKKPICFSNSKEILAFLEKAKKYISELSIYNKNKITKRGYVFIKFTKKKLVQCKSKTGFLGFLICIESLKYLYTSLVTNDIRLRYISTDRLSQNHIEILFRDTRLHGEYYNNNPNAVQFRDIYKKMFTHLELRTNFTGNCMPVEYYPTFYCSSAVKNINNTCDGRINDENPIEDIHKLQSDKVCQQNVFVLADYLNGDLESYNIEQIVGYISGWVSRTLCRSLKCEICRTYLFSNEKLWFHKLVTLKDMGGLCLASHGVFLVCLKSELIIKKFMKHGPFFNNTQFFQRLQYSILKLFCQTNVFNDLTEHSMNQNPTLNHRLQLIRAIIQKYLNVRVYPEHNIKQFSTKVPQRNTLNLLK